jgi:hypothetical protein
MLKKIVFLYLLFLVFFSGCNEEPTNIGIDILRDTILISAISSDTADLITNYEVFDQKSPIFNTGAFFVGKTENMEAMTLLRFGQIPDSLEYLTNDDIISCKLTLFPNNYAIGDYQNSSLSFKLKKIKSLWSNYTEYSEVKENPDKYFENEEYEGWSGNIKIQDSIPPVTFDFPRDIITDWFQKQHSNADTNNVADTIWGVALLPDNESNVIHRFSGLGQSEEGDYTIIETVYTNSEGETDTLKLISAIEFSLFDDNRPYDEDIVIQGGISLRTRLDFDLSALPDLASVHKSELVLSYNKDKSYWGNNGPDSVIALRLYDEILPDIHTAVPILEWTSYLDDENDKYTFESISSAVETWVRTPDKKGSIVLLAMPLEEEFRQLDRMVFYGTDAVPELRPKIKIIYSYIEENSN